MTVLTAGMEGPFHTGPLALAANAYWYAGARARLALEFGTARAAAEQAEILVDIADAGHPGIRDRVVRHLLTILPRIDARYAETRA